MRRVGSLGSVVVLALVASAPPALAGDVARGKDIAFNGAAAGVPACSGCHGVNGEGQNEIPHLAGLNGDYLHHQLVAFGNSTRDNAMMSSTAKAMDASAMADVTTYYASLPAPAEASVPTQGANPDQAGQEQAKRGNIELRGATLALHGDWAANVPPCASCHGAKGLGVGASFPAIAGQWAAYTTNALQAWKDGSRHDDPLGLMRTVASRLDAGQIAAVSAYYAALPAASVAERKP